MVIGANTADTYHLPYISGWALAHGTIFLLFPIYILAAYLFLTPLIGYVNRGTLRSESTGERNSLLAMLSLASSGLGIVIPIAGSIVAIAFGHAAKSYLKSDVNLRGGLIATTGLVIGYVTLIYWLYEFFIIELWVPARDS